MLDSILAGQSNRQIAEMAHLSEGTVKNHVSTLLLLFGLRARPAHQPTALKPPFVSASHIASSLLPDTDTETARRAQRAQVSALYAPTGSSTLADTLLAWALCAVFYWRLRDPMVLAWLGLHMVQLLRYPLFSAYHRDPQAAGRSEFWARRHSRELLFYSSTVSSPKPCSCASRKRRWPSNWRSKWP